jgi:hypothetical protein
MRQWAIFLCAAMTGSFTTGASVRIGENRWWYALVDVLLAAGFAAVAWYHLEKLQVKP